MAIMNFNFTTVSEPVCEEMRILENCNIRLDGNIVEGGLTFRNCTISDVQASINNCTFENCKIDCESLTNCKLINCSSISVYDGMIKGCKFTAPTLVSVCRCNISNCEFSDISVDGDDDCGLILAEDTCISSCYFHDIRLTGGCYLINAVGDCAVTNCGFTDCSTSRRDFEIICCEGSSIADDTCAGLNDVTHIDI